MTAPTGINWGVDVFRAVAFPLDSSGLPQPTSTTVYEGLEVQGVQSFDATFAKPRTIVNVAQGRVRDLIYLPPNQASTAQLKTGYDQQDLVAALMGVKKVTDGNRTFYSHMTDKQGKEPNVSLFVNQLAVHNDQGDVSWHSYFIPRARMIWTPASFNQNASEYMFDIAISKSLKTFSGLQLSIATNGCTEEGLEDVMSNECVNVVTWLADGTVKDFLVPTAKPMSDFTTPSAVLYDMTTKAALVPDTFDATGFHFTTTAPTAAHVLMGIYDFAA